MAVSPTAVVAVTPTFFAEPVILISSCLDGSALVPAVTLVVTSSSSSALDTVTLHLIDGANVGGPTVTFPNATLTGLFGTTSVAGTRSFPFRPIFSCPTTSPRAVVVDGVLVDRVNNRTPFSVSAAVR